VGLAREAAATGARSIYLQVERDNPEALALYETLGFREVYGYHYRVVDRPGTRSSCSACEIATMYWGAARAAPFRRSEFGGTVPHARVLHVNISRCSALDSNRLSH
jgi:hypothetical protein